MAKLKDGIFGPASGSVGNVIIAMRNGVPYIRSKPAKVHNPRTPKQLAVRMKLSLLNRVLCNLKPVINVGFPDPPGGKTSRDIAYSVNYPVVFKGEYPDIEIRFDSLRISSGTLSPAEEVTANLSDDQLSVSWGTKTGGTKHDLAMLVVYNSLSGQSFYSLRAAERQAGWANLEVPQNISDDLSHLHGWIAFVSPDGKKCSESRALPIGN